MRAERNARRPRPCPRADEQQVGDGDGHEEGAHAPTEEQPCGDELEPAGEREADALRERLARV